MSFHWDALQEPRYNKMRLLHDNLLPYMPQLPIPECFSDEFMMSPMKQTQWNAFIRKNQLRENPGNFYDAALRIKSFLLPVLLPRTDTPTQWKAAQGWE